MTLPRLNFIIYRPGRCGHFLEFLFNLSPETWNQIGGRDPWRYYSFRDLHQRYGSWYNHHHYHWVKYGPPDQRLREFVDSGHPLAVISTHPLYFNYPRINRTDVHYYSVDCSDELAQRVCNDFFASTRYKQHINDPTVEETELELEWYHRTEQFTPMSRINLDLIVEPSTFYAEYSRVCSDMGITAQDQTRVTEFYLDWLRARGLDNSSS